MIGDPGLRWRGRLAVFKDIVGSAGKRTFEGETAFAFDSISEGVGHAGYGEKS